MAIADDSRYPLFSHRMRSENKLVRDRLHDVVSGSRRLHDLKYGTVESILAKKPSLWWNSVRDLFSLVSFCPKIKLWTSYGQVFREKVTPILSKPPPQTAHVGESTLHLYLIFFGNKIPNPVHSLCRVCWTHGEGPKITMVANH